MHKRTNNIYDWFTVTKCSGLQRQYESSRALAISSRPHFSGEHIVMVMTLCEGVHFHISTSLIILFLLFPPEKIQPHLFNQAKQIPPLNPPLFPDCSPPKREVREVEWDAILPIGPGLTCPCWELVFCFFSMVSISAICCDAVSRCAFN